MQLLGCDPYEMVPRWSLMNPDKDWSKKSSLGYCLKMKDNQDRKLQLLKRSAKFSLKHIFSWNFCMNNSQKWFSLWNNRFWLIQGTSDFGCWCSRKPSFSKIYSIFEFLIGCGSGGLNCISNPIFGEDKTILT